MNWFRIPGTIEACSYGRNYCCTVCGHDNNPARKCLIRLNEDFSSAKMITALCNNGRLWWLDYERYAEFDHLHKPFLYLCHKCQNVKDLSVINFKIKVQISELDI